MKKAVLMLSILPIVLQSGSAIAGERLDNINKNHTLNVCIWPDYFAISYRNPRTMQLEGIDIDMAYELGKSLGAEVNFVESSFAQLIENMTNNQCDIAMHGVGVRDDRKPYMEFAEPHLASGIYAVAMKNSETVKTWQDIDQTGNIVVVQKGTYMEPVMLKYLKHAELNVVDSFKAREQEVMSGRADVFMTDYPYGKRMAALTQWANLLEPDAPIAPTSYAYAVPKGDDEWLATVNAFVKEIKKNGKLAESAAKHGLTPIVSP